MEIKYINEQVSVSPQISVADVKRIKAAGYVAIVNNRPDAEEEDQPWGEDIEAEAARLGIPYYFIPVGGMPFSPQAIAKTKDVLAKYEGPVFFFCRSGTRCAKLWANTQIGELLSDEIIALAARAGYDVGGLLEEIDIKRSAA